MKKITTVIFSVLMLFSFTGCSNRFMKDSEIKKLEQNPKGVITLSYLANPRDESSKKEIELEFTLFYDKAPITVTNFVNLVKEGFYNDTYIPNFNLMEGQSKIDILCDIYGEDDPDTTIDESLSFIKKTLNHYIKGEFSDNKWQANDIKHTAWTMSMIREQGFDTADFKFTICIDDLSEERDGKYAAFGRLELKNTNVLLNTLKDISIEGANHKLKIETITVESVDLGKTLTIKK